MKSKSSRTSMRTTNQLLVIRRRLGLTRKQVAAIIGYKADATLAKIERGVQLPPLSVLFKLEILYRTPLSNLYPELYTTVRDVVRAAEAALLKRSEHEEDHAHA
jgi:transcriptional regulator with XRE-family HTH domain